MEFLSPPNSLPVPRCSECDRPAKFTSRIRHYRRGARVLAVPTGSWICPHCVDPFTGEGPFRFSDAPLMIWTDNEAKRLWKKTFREIMPPSEQGQHKTPHRSVRVPVMLTPAETIRLDEARGRHSRSEFLRQVLRP